MTETGGAVVCAVAQLYKAASGCRLGDLWWKSAHLTYLDVPGRKLEVIGSMVGNWLVMTLYLYSRGIPWGEITH